MVAATRRVDPPLLRAMRTLNPRAPLNAGLEGALWCHGDVAAVHTATVRADARDRHLAHFADRLKGLHAELDRHRVRHHCHLRVALNHEETALWAARVDDDAIARSRGARDRIAGAVDFFGRLAATLTRPGPPSSVDWSGVAQGIEQRADARMWDRYAVELHGLAAARLRADGPSAPIPDHADPAMLARLLGPDQPTVRASLVRDAASGCLVLQAEPAGARQSQVGPPIAIDAGGVGVRMAGRGAKRWLSAAALPAALARLDEPSQLVLETSRHRVTIAAVRRPRGAAGWSCDRGGFTVRCPPLVGPEIRWGGDRLEFTPPAEGDRADLWALETEVLALNEPDDAVWYGIDVRFGVFATLRIETEHGRATQRLRRIEPGRFRMGSPEDEPGRDGDEGPQHEVTISQGFWLFDTPCTQALWRAVMGRNPSKF